jgi:hypothetical protein
MDMIPFKVYSNIQNVNVGYLINTNNSAGITFQQRIDLDFIPDLIVLKELNVVIKPGNPATSETIFNIDSSLVPNNFLVSFPVCPFKVFASNTNSITNASTIYSSKPNFIWLNKSNKYIRGEYLFQLYSPIVNNFNFEGHLSLTFEFIKY